MIERMTPYSPNGETWPVAVGVKLKGIDEERAYIPHQSVVAMQSEHAREVDALHAQIRELRAELRGKE